MGNYRPISLLPTFSKLFEKLFLIRMNSFLRQFNIISKTQYGFTEGKSTIEAINEFIEFTVSNLDEKKKTLSVFLDLTKAFDCVNHSKLLDILYSYGIRGISYNWIKTYLSNRTHQVQIGNELSNVVDLSHGVPQGSILGPTLFILYVNACKDIVSGYHSNKCNVLQYADDTTLSFNGHSSNCLKELAIEKTISCVEYFKTLDLSTNFSKTYYINFGFNQDIDKFNFNINNDCLQEADYIKFLGLFIDKKLSWDHHIDLVCNRVSKGLFLLRKLSFNCTQDVLKMAYYGIIHPHLSYGLCLWGSCSETKLQRIFVLQKKAIRIISRINYRESCRESFKALSILPLPSQYILDTVLFFISKYSFGEQNNAYNTRNQLIRPAYHRLHLYDKLPMEAGRKLYNKLPTNLQQLNLKTFKIKLKQFLNINSFYSVAEYLDN
jgi:hypothetical protein